MISGYGLHSGSFCRVFFHHEPGPVRFRQGTTIIPAELSYVTGTQRCTVLGKDTKKIALVEHLLAAMHAVGWWQDVLIEVEGDELPILDGSAIGWLEPLAVLGLASPPPAPLHITKPVTHSINGTDISLLPGQASLEVSIDFDHPAIGKQCWAGTSHNYKELLDARTFGFLKELEALRAAGLAALASLDNALVFTDAGPLQSLRYPDEPVRHKAIDALGDFFLLGRPLEGQLKISRGSHQSHTAFLRQLMATLPEARA